MKTGNFIQNSTHQTCQITSKLREAGELRERQYLRAMACTPFWHKSMPHDLHRLCRESIDVL